MQPQTGLLTPAFVTCILYVFFLHITKFAELAVSELVNEMRVSLSSVEKTEI